jgi:subtilisin family serine protease
VRAYRYPAGSVRRRVLIVLIVALCGASTAAAATGRVQGDPLQAQEWWLAAIGADPAAAPGPGVPITVIDSGVDPASPEFAGRPNTTFLNSQTVDGPGEYHGTAVASLAVAPANGVGIVGVYPQAVFQSFDASPVGQITDMTAAQGIVAAAQHCPGVISISFGGTNQDSQLENAVLYALHNGCLLVAAAGNGGLEGNPPEYPASYPHVLSVGATDQNGAVAPFSTLSPTLDVSAPGVAMIGVVPLTRDPSGYLPSLSGTSFAAPLVSAAAAWIWTLRPTLDAGQIFQLVLESAHDVGSPGWDSASGFGVVNIPAALAAPPPAVDPQEPNDDIDQIKPGGLFADGRPPLTTTSKPSIRVAGRIDQVNDPRDLYRIWVPAHHVVRAHVAGGDAAARIWGPQTVGVGERILQRRRDLKGPLIRGGNVGAIAYVEVLLTGKSPSASYVLEVTASKH